MKTYALINILFLTLVANALVGIGTTTPSNDAVLDLTCLNKGLLLPGLSDTSNVSNPTSGLITPFYSVKLSNFKVVAVSTGVSVGTEILESISLEPGIIAFRDWTNNNGFSYNLDTKVIGPY